MTYEFDKKPAIVWDSLNEAPQTHNTKFSFALVEGNKVRPLHTYVRCRDYLGDILYARHFNKNFYIYGMRYNPAEMPSHNKDKTQLLVADTNAKNFQDNLHFLHELEEKNNIPKTKIHLVYPDFNIFLVEGDKFWQKAAFTMSIYTHLLRAMEHKYLTNDWATEISVFPCSEGAYLKTVTVPLYKKVTAKLREVTETLKDPCGHPIAKQNSMSIIHECSGFVTILQHGQYYKGHSVADEIRRLGLV